MWKRRLAWAACLFAAAALWLFENNAATLTLLLASILLPAASILAAKRGAGKTAQTLHVSPGGAKGNELRAALCAAPMGLFFRTAGRVSCENRLTGERAELPVSFLPRRSGRAELTLALDTAHCGTLRLETEMWTEDLFGLWRSRPVRGAREFVTVEPELFLPTVLPTENTTVISDGEQYSRTRPGSDPSETFAIREYRPGDPIRQIHWKLSQKTDEPMLRELGLPVVNQTLLVFRNLLSQRENVSPETADAMAEVFLSLSRALTNALCPHTAAFAEGGQFLLTEVRSEVDFHAMEQRFLTLGWENDDGALSRLLTETPYAHVAIVSAAAPPDAQSFCRGNRVTILTASPASETAGVVCVPFSADGYREELQYIEL